MAINMLPPFKRWTLENFPFIEDDFDAITNYELYCKIVEYLKKIAENQDILDSKMNNFEVFINNYFENLDVQEEINNKLDEMAEDGTLEEIITEYINLKSILCYDTVSDMQNATNLVNGSYARTLGYHTINDGGGATYKITNTYNSSVHQETIGSTLYATLIVDNEINPKQFGAYCDGTHEDQVVFTECINYAINNNLPIHIIGTLTLASAYELTSANTTLTIKGDGCGGTFSPEYVAGSVSNILLKGNSRFISGLTYTNSTNNYPKLSINLQGINFYSDSSGEKYIFENVYITGSIIKNNTSRYLGLSKGTIAVVTVIDSNKFVSLTKFMTRGSVGTRELMSDCVITNNYISGLNAGYCFDNVVCGNVRLTNNFIDYFKTIFGNANMGGTLLSSGNIYDGYCFIIEGSSSQAMGQLTFLNDRFFTLSKARAVELGHITNDDIKCSFKIDLLNYNIEVINPKIRYHSAEVVCDESFIYGALYSPTGNLKVSLINPTYTSNDGSTVANVRLNVNKLINVKLTGSTASQIFANSGIAYVPARIDTLAEAPAIQRDGSYILPAWYRYYNTTDGKLYEFRPTGAFVAITE